MRLAILILVALATPAVADLHKNKARGVSIDIPHDWTKKVANDDVFASDPTAKAALMLTTSAGKTPADVVADAGRALAKGAQAIKWGKLREQTINGKQVTVADGTGKTGDVAIKTRVVVAMVKGQGVYLLLIVATDDEAAHRTELDHVLGSFKID